jgi:hypothetical protein
MIILQQLRLDPHSFPLAERLIHDFPHPQIDATYKTCQNYNLEDLTQQLSKIKNSSTTHTMKYLPSKSNRHLKSVRKEQPKRKQKSVRKMKKKTPSKTRRNKKR